MAEASPGKDSVTGHWEMAGIVLDRPFPTFPGGFPRRRDRRLRAPHRPRHARQRGGVGHRDHRPARATSTCGRASRSSTRRPTACSRWRRTRTSSRSPSSTACARPPSTWSGRGLGVGRVIARPFVGATGAFRRTANRHDYALEPTGDDAARRADGGRPRRGRHRQGARPVRRPRHHARAADGERRRRHGHVDAGARATTADGLIFVNLVDTDTQYGHRNDVAGLRRQPRAHRRGPRPTLRAALRAGRSARRHRPITATTRRRRAPTTRASTCRCSLTGARRARRARPRHARDVRRSRADASPRTSASGRWRTARAFSPT